ncbi:hypothetical protein [Nostoc favosum]|uniref:Uncharacterized protein n=1 Tax=Nostoc favosum CHAB5714 TaxID=2780399 RepID=A0ABS8I9U3_9NOSO|nr:hypothetical protein [Nostoc favosum]MCC5600631.1 hypothetical protein [Nostoc favosum CHAB5714]
MLVTNNIRIKGRELSASLDTNILIVYRHGDNTPVMQTCYSQGNWYEEIPTRLTRNEIEQIDSPDFSRHVEKAILRVFQTLIFPLAIFINLKLLTIRL